MDMTPHTLTREQVNDSLQELRDCPAGVWVFKRDAIAEKLLSQHQALAQMTQRLKELETRCNNFHIDALMWRGVEPDDTCAECGGSGTKGYANTSTFHYGAGGQSMTLSVCDKCWGSGNKHRPWPSWKQQAQEVERLRTGQGISSAEMDLSKQLATMTAERDAAVESRRLFDREMNRMLEKLASILNKPRNEVGYENGLDQLVDQLAASQARARENACGEPTCHRQSPGGDCEHMIGLHGQATDEYGKPVDWCWWCWKQRQLAQLQATLAERERRIQGLETELEEYRSLAEKLGAEKAVSERDTARQDAARLREALKFYADPHSYGLNGGSSERIIKDHGQQAHRALKGA